MSKNSEDGIVQNVTSTQGLEQKLEQEKEVESVVIRFSGDSGDGMQLTGTQFSNASALMGNDISTFPDYPSEIRAPQGTIAGVSGFQIHIGATEINTPGDEPDVLICMNAAALRANLKDLKKGGIIVVNTDAFDEKSLEKAGYKSNPLEDESLSDYNVYKCNVTTQTIEATEGIDLDRKSKVRCKNFFALGLTCQMFSRKLDSTIEWIEDKFSKTPALRDANIAALKAGRNFADANLINVTKYNIPPAKIRSGTYRQINGNTGTAWGLMQAAESAGLKLFLGSYPITPATDILHELSKHRSFDVKTFQAEDEIAGICSAIGAAFGGALAATTTSGPGLALKTEALGLAVIMELPLVIVDVQRGGPSTGLPTKTEQSDLLQALWGRNGECPMIVIAASRPSDCFEMSYEAARLALHHMTPVLLLTDGYIANGAEPWRIPDIKKEYRPITHKLVKDNSSIGENKKFNSYVRDDELVRPWAIPGMKGFEHRIGGLEKENITGAVSHNPENHELMVNLRAKKIEKVVDNIPLQELEGNSKGDLLVISWGGTYGATHTAVKRAQDAGKKVSLAHVKYLNPLPKNFGEILDNFERVLIPELNLGQLRIYLSSMYKREFASLSKIQGLPFRVTEIEKAIYNELEKINNK